MDMMQFNMVILTYSPI